MRRLPPKDAKAWLIKLVKELGKKRLAIIAAGAFADPEAIPFLIGQMKDPNVAKVAGESFSLITGSDIAYEDLDGEPPEASRPARPRSRRRTRRPARRPELALARSRTDPEMVERSPGEFRQRNALRAGPADHLRIAPRGAQEWLPAAAGGGGDRTGYPQARPSPVRGPGLGGGNSKSCRASERIAGTSTAPPSPENSLGHTPWPSCWLKPWLAIEFRVSPRRK